jgi:hypothetical protein
MILTEYTCDECKTEVSVPWDGPPEGWIELGRGEGLPVHFVKMFDFCGSCFNVMVATRDMRSNG